MNNFAKKVITILLTAALALNIGLPAFAATQVSWSNAWYKPYQARVSFQRTYVQGANMKWSSSQISNFLSDGCWELEFRPCTMGGVVQDPNVVYDESAGCNLVSTLPNAYKEFDENDVSIGCKYGNTLQPETTYMGTLYLTSNSSSSGTSYKAVIENELGSWFGVDGLPLSYAQWSQYPVLGGSSLTW